MTVAPINSLMSEMETSINALILFGEFYFLALKNL